jgi:hypothetical protein
VLGELVAIHHRQADVEHCDVGSIGRSGPQPIHIAKREVSTMLAAARRVSGQPSASPGGVSPQPAARMSFAISLSPENKGGDVAGEPAVRINVRLLDGALQEYPGTGI